jgi:thiamine-monophosphate kinase
MLPRNPCAAPRPVDEFELIQRYFVRDGEARGVTTGIGDDGAVLQPEPGRELITVIDTLVETVHFPADISPADLGYRCVAVNLSDIAAMGGRPLWMTLALTIPASDDEWLSGFASGLHEAAAEHDVSLVGGDTTRGDAIVISVQISGDVAEGAAVHRSGACSGDTIYVTGTLGDAGAGLALLSAGNSDEFLLQRFLRPTARVSAGLALPGLASSAIDISDGLLGDLQKLLDASDVGGEIQLDALPTSDAFRAAFDKKSQRRFALTAGDDYELCFTSSREVPSELGGVPVTAIGTITDGHSLICRDHDEIVEITDSGYRHFQ